MYRHKVFTYIEYRAVSSVFRTINPPPPLPLASVSSPAPKAGVTHSPGGEGAGGVNISEDARHWIGLLQYNPSTCTGVGEVEGYDGQLCSHLPGVRQGDQGKTTVLPTLFVIYRPVWQKSSTAARKVLDMKFPILHGYTIYICL